jgi:Carboxypeptidase regulatory-like domain
MTAHYLACTVGLAVWILSAASAATANLQGTVVDSEGAAIANAHVVVRADLSTRRNRTRNPDSVIDTDSGGRFMLELQPGFYDVCVMADAFSPSCQKVLVTSDDVLRPRIQLKADPEVMKRIGDVF